MKLQYTNFLHDVCSMSDDNRYSIHYEFSSSATALDELQIQQIFPLSADMEIPLIYAVHV